MILETATGSLYPLTPHKSISRKLHVLKLQCLVSDQIAEGSFLLHPGSFFAVTEVEDSDKAVISLLTEDTENTVIMNIICIHITVFIKNRFLAADLLHAAKSLEDLSLNGGFGVSFSGKLPLESTTVDIAGICSLIRILFIGIIIETSDFIGIPDWVSIYA